MRVHSVFQQADTSNQILEDRADSLVFDLDGGQCCPIGQSRQLNQRDALFTASASIWHAVLTLGFFSLEGNARFD